MKKKKAEIITNTRKMKCWKCDGIKFLFPGKISKIKTTKNSVTGWIKFKKCPTCKGTGIYKEKSYIIIYQGKDGKRYGFPMDNIN